MPQVPAQTYSEDGAIDYTPSSAVLAGDVVVLNGIIGVAADSIAANEKGALQTEGVWRIPKSTGVITRGLPVFWNATGNPDNGDVGSGAANQLGVGVYMGLAAEAAASGDDFAMVEINRQYPALVGVAAVTATGSVQGDAAALYHGFNVVTGADGTKGVILPTALPGMIVYLKGVTNAILKVYPRTGAAINGLSANASLNMTTGLMPSIFIASSSTQWYTIPLVAS